MSTTARADAFALLRFAAAPLGAELAVVEIEGRFPAGGRFARGPVLLLDGAHRLELAPVRSTLTGEQWAGTYAVPATALDGDVRFALQLRGTVLDLPAPDVAPGTDRFTALARESNALRRALDQAEAQVETLRAELAAAERDSEQTLAAMAAEYQEALAAVGTEHEGALAAVAVEHEEVMARLRREHGEVLAATQAQAAADANEIAALREEIDRLRTEERETREQLRAARAERAERETPRVPLDDDVTEILPTLDPASVAPGPDARPGRPPRSPGEPLTHVGPMPLRWIPPVSLALFFLLVLLLLFAH